MLEHLRRILQQSVLRLLGRHLPTKPQVHCETLQLGGPGYGAGTICSKIARGGLIYSFGCGEDISWDLAMIEQLGVTVHVFDPTPRSIAWVKLRWLPDQFVFHEYGMADYDGVALFYPPENSEWVSHTLLERWMTANQAIEVPVSCFKTIMSNLGHKRVDLIKMDIEGAGYAVVEDMLNTEPVAGGVDQSLIEFHHLFAGKGIGDTMACIRALNRNGFQAFHISRTGEEWSFLRHG
jgi:FkbM family methyltransferase